MTKTGRFGVRDSDDIGAMDIGVRCLVTSPRKSAKEGSGQRAIAVSFGGATFRPGAWVIATATVVSLQNASWADRRGGQPSADAGDARCSAD